MASVKELPLFDAAKYLNSNEAIAAFLSDALQTGESRYIAHAFGIVARAKGVAQIAEETGLAREQLYRSFSENGNPTLKTLLAVMKALGVELSAQPETKRRGRRRLSHA
ncbi:MAG: addiction module antidote protein [Vulcanimicrobiaceae bacterium]